MRSTTVVVALTGEVTVISQLKTFSLTIALIVAVPAEIAVTKPFSTVATLLAVEVQITSMLSSVAGVTKTLN